MLLFHIVNYFGNIIEKFITIWIQLINLYKMKNNLK